jgi:hypothetical protein
LFERIANRNVAPAKLENRDRFLKWSLLAICLAMALPVCALEQASEVKLVENDSVTQTKPVQPALQSLPYLTFPLGIPLAEFKSIAQKKGVLSSLSEQKLMIGEFDPSSYIFAPPVEFEIEGCYFQPRFIFSQDNRLREIHALVYDSEHHRLAESLTKKFGAPLMVQHKHFKSAPLEMWFYGDSPDTACAIYYDSLNAVRIKYLSLMPEDKEGLMEKWKTHKAVPEGTSKPSP